MKDGIPEDLSRAVAGAGLYFHKYLYFWDRGTTSKLGPKVKIALLRPRI